MKVDVRLAQKGRRESLEALIQQGRASLGLAQNHQEALALDGWPLSKTEALAGGLSALEALAASRVEATRASQGKTRSEDQARSDAKAFLRRLNNALPVVLREAGVSDLEASDFSPRGRLQRSTPKILAHLRTIRASVERLDEPLKAHFRGELASAQLDKVRSALESADTEQEVTLTELPLETQKVLEAKGRVLELLEDLNRAARNAFDGNAPLIALFNKDLLLRARRARPAKQEPPAGGLRRLRPRGPCLPWPTGAMLRPMVSRPAIRHLPALDGLRGLALLGVLFFHADGALRGGYLGVDLFFVLSGYLITALLLVEHRQQGSVALGPFWERRFRRLMPALLSLMPAVALHARFLAEPGALAGLRAEALATLGYVANWRAILAKKSYWDLFAAPSPLEHTWSLAIEEQFYVLWPPLVALLLRRGRGALLGATAALGACSVGAALALYDPASTSRVYLGTDTRAAGILAGAALAQALPMDTVFSRRAARWLDALGIAAAAGLAVAWWRLSGAHPFLYRGGLWLTELAALVLIACAVAGPASLVGRALAFRPLALVGTISYGLYLWHWPINVALTAERLRIHGFGLHALRFALTFAVAIASYRLLERPIRQRGVPWGRPWLVVPAAVGLAVAVVLAGTWPRPLPPPPAVAAPAEPVTFPILILGDSTANSLGWVIRGLRAPGVAVELRGQDGCTMLADMCRGPLWAQDTEEIRPKATLVFLGGAFLHGLTLDDGWRTACYPGWRARFEGTLHRRLGELRAPGVRVWLATIPYPLGPYDSEEFRTLTDCINASIRASAAAVEGIHLLDLGGRLCPASGCERVSEGVQIRPDGVHYTMEGGAALARWLLERLQGPTPP